jgi:predicted MFS family arabinose efflux permease
MTSHLTPKRERWLLLTLASIQFTSVLDFMIMMPLGPQLTELFGISAGEFGFLVSAYTFAAGLSGLLAATYIDRFGRKRMMLTLYPLFGVAALACSFAPTFAWLMLARVASGFFGGVLMALSQTIVAEVIPFERRGRAMGVVMTSFSVATVAGVPMSLFLASHFNWHAPFLAIALMVSVCALGAAKTLPSLKGHLAAHPDWRFSAEHVGQPALGVSRPQSLEGLCHVIEHGVCGFCSHSLHHTLFARQCGL